MKIAVAGTGYVGLVTGVCLAEHGHLVTCVDVDEKKVELMKKGVSPIYEEGLPELMAKNMEIYPQELEKSFIMGFKTGARLMCEIFSEETE